MRRRSIARIVAIALLLLSCLPGVAEEKKDEAKKTPPSVKVALPIGIARGGASKLMLRGTALAEATAVHVVNDPAGVRAEIKSKGNSDGPKPAEGVKAPDSQIELELTIPAELSVKEVSLVVVTPEGEAKPYTLRVLDGDTLTVEKEPNGGFHAAQEIHVPGAVQGVIGEANDVDVFRFTAKAGQKLTAEVFAARYGSSLDSLLTLYDAHGHILAENDDSESGTDSLVHVTLPTDGTYYLGVTDANEKGSALHAYLLVTGVE